MNRIVALMKFVGLTGGIGSGKSTVGKVFSTLGIPVYNADLEGRRLSDTDPIIIAGLTALFGDKIYQAGKLQRPILANYVFNNAELLQKINAIIHPVVEDDFKQWALQFGHLPYVVKEAAILVENGGWQRVDHLILVVAPEELRIQRVQRRDGASYDQVQARMRNQMADEEKLKYANSVICCDEHHLVIPQVINIHSKLIL